MSFLYFNVFFLLYISFFACFFSSLQIPVLAPGYGSLRGCHRDNNLRRQTQTHNRPTILAKLPDCSTPLSSGFHVLPCLVVNFFHAPAPSPQQFEYTFYFKLENHDFLVGFRGIHKNCGCVATCFFAAKILPSGNGCCSNGHG